MNCRNITTTGLKIIQSPSDIKRFIKYKRFIIDVCKVSFLKLPSYITKTIAAIITSMHKISVLSQNNYSLGNIHNMVSVL